MSGPLGIQLIATIALASAALTGCASPKESIASPSPVSEAGNTPSPSQPAVDDGESTPTPGPESIELSDPGSWLITFDGVGPLTVGGQVSEQREAMTAFSEEPRDYCPRAIFSHSSGQAPSVWAMLDGDFETINAVVVPGVPDLMSPVAGSPKTAEGIGLGSSVVDLLAAYPDISAPVASNNSLVYAVNGGADRWIDFMTTNEGYVLSIVVIDVPKPPSEYCG
jgi:hypothetical protein